MTNDKEYREAVYNALISAPVIESLKTEKRKLTLKQSRLVSSGFYNSQKKKKDHKLHKFQVEQEDIKHLAIKPHPETNIDALDQEGKISMKAIDNDWILVKLPPWLRRVTFGMLMFFPPLHPSHGFLKWWMTVRICFAIANVVHCLICPAFNLQHPGWYMIGLFFDFVSVSDMLIGSHTAYFNRNGVLVTHPYWTLRRYLKTNFFTDFVASFPFEMIIFFFAYRHIYFESYFDVHWLKFLSYVRLTRTLNFVRIPAYFGLMEQNIKKDTGSMRYIKYSIYVSLYLIFMTCVPLLVQCSPSSCIFSPPDCYNLETVVHREYNSLGAMKSGGLEYDLRSPDVRKINGSWLVATKNYVDKQNLLKTCVRRTFLNISLSELLSSK